MIMKPKLRAVQPSLIEHEGAPFILLRDPLSLAEGSLLIPQAVGPLLLLCDGGRDINELEQAFGEYTGIQLPQGFMEQMIAKLDDMFLLDNGRSEEAVNTALEAFRAAGHRVPALSGGGYPSDAGELRLLLSSYIEGHTVEEPSGLVRGIISPHIDYHRGGAVYAQVWQKAALAIENAERVIIFGTNHNGGKNLFGFTRQDYSTPLGVISTDVDTVDRIAGIIGHDLAFEDELYHINEHSIELALVWLQYYLGNNSSCQLIPILCGSFERFVHGEQEPYFDHEIEALIDCLKDVASSRRTVVVAAADLAHMGPAFGDPTPLSEVQKKSIGEADAQLLESMCLSDSDAFYAAIKNERDSRRICGLAPIYLTLRLVGEANGDVCGYDLCPADPMNTSVVSICGVVLE